MCYNVKYLIKSQCQRSPSQYITAIFKKDGILNLWRQSVGRRDQRKTKCSTLELLNKLFLSVNDAKTKNQAKLLIEFLGNSSAPLEASSKCSCCIYFCFDESFVLESAV